MNFPWLVLGAMGTAGIAAVTARYTRQYFFAAVAGSAFILLLHGWFYFHYTSDDAYISFRYARNLADGAGLVWNPGEHVEGYSNFLWVITLAALARTGADIVLSARWLGFGLAVVASAGTYVLATQLLPEKPGRWAGLAATMLLAASGAWAAWTFAGLETPLFAALVVAAVLLHIGESEGELAPLSGMVWALACMTRPDGVVLFGVSVAFKLGEVVTDAREAGPSERGREIWLSLLRLIAWAAGFLALFLPYFLWRYAEYGWLFPNTYYNKVGSGLDQFERGLRYLAAFNEESAGWLLLLAPLAIAMTPIRKLASTYVLMLIIAWFGYVVYVGGDSLARLRFFAPVLPLFYALIVASGAAIVSSLMEAQKARLAGGTVALACAALMGFTLYASAGDFGLPSERDAVKDRVEMGRWLRGNVPASTVIAVIPAGAIPYESRLTAIDMLGLTDEHIAHRDLQLGKLGAGHEKYDSTYVLDRQPDIIILTDELSATRWQRADYGTFESGLIAARIDMVRQERLWNEYEPRSAEVEGRWFNLLVRRDANAVLARTQAAGP